jgi:hypothetical protein
VFNAKVGFQVVGNQMQGLYVIYFGLNTNNWCIGVIYEPQMTILKRKNHILIHIFLYVFLNLSN